MTNQFERFSFHPYILKAIEERGFKKPTDIQERVIPATLKGTSIIGQSQTGTGKTHVLASIVADFPGKVLIVAHRVELVEQIRETILKLRIENEKLKKTAINCQKSEIINHKS